MKVGMIGLGRMGEGMSRRMIKAGHEVYGYRNNVKKSEEQYKKGYISGYTNSLESLVEIVKRGVSIYGEKSGETLVTEKPGIFIHTMMNQIPLLIWGTITFRKCSLHFAWDLLQCLS